jgi:hypothetical protein
MMLVVYCLLSSLVTLANEYRLDVLAQLPALSSANIISVISLPIESKNKHQYLLVDDTGELSLLNGNDLLSLSRLPLSNQATSKQAKLTAMTLHPSFALADKTGYQTFFTAHIEPRKTNNNVARLTLLENPITLPFDAVITQWKYDSKALHKIDEQQRREVMRIAVPTATHQIQKIAFNPYNKLWHDDYGLMHVALSESKSNLVNTPTDVLYSGVVLRINPEKFGLRNYMVPSSNPFMKTQDVNNELFVVGAQSISSFSWSKQHYGALLVLHTYDGVHQVVVADKGADWRDAYQNNHVFTLKSKQEFNGKIHPYYGRNLKTLVGSIIYLTNNTKNWQLAKLDTSIEDSNTKKQSMGQTTWSFNRDDLPPENKVSLLFDHAGEPLLLDITNKQLLSVTPNQLITDKDSDYQTKDKQNTPSDTHKSSAYGKLLLVLFILILAVVFYRLRPKNNPAKAKLRSHFARFELDKAQKTLLFYKRHESEIDSKLAIKDIVKSEVLLNNTNVSIINKDIEHGYNEQCENKLRVSFKQAHRHKLIDDEIRQVDLYLTDINNKTHIVCLYLRKGNQRLTKAKYFDTLESLNDWSWFIAQQLNPQATDKRKIKVTASEPHIIKTPIKIRTPQVDIKASKEIEEVTPDKSKKELHDIAMHDSQLINALDKLVDLKQKGFLTDEEFSLAKAKILSDITDQK